MIQDNGSVSKNVKYKHVCKEQFPVHVAYNYDYFWLEIENNKLVDTIAKYSIWTHGWLVGRYSWIAMDWEILSIFFKNYNVIVKWINCNSTYGIIDDETGKWTGLVGQVNMDG